jgi:nucleoside-diphosphate-sugar epimerase
MTGAGRVVILGASGFLGRALETVLSREGVEVVGHSSRTLDLTRPEAFGVLDPHMTPATTLVVASGLTPDRGQTPSTFLANTTMAVNLATYLDGHRPGSVVYLGSDAVYGFGEAPVTETTAVEPTGYYALGKYAAERVLDSATRAAAVPFLTLRLTGIYGPGDPHGSYGPNTFARSLARDHSVRVFGAGEEERDHVFVEDAAAIAVGLIRSRATGVYNVATGHSHSFADVVKSIRDLVPYEVQVSSAPRKGPITHRRFDVTRLVTTLPGFRFTSLETGLTATLSAFGAFARG